MEPESGSGPPSKAPPEDLLAEGWLLGSEGVAFPDPSNKKTYPLSQRIERLAKQDAALLDANEATQREVTQLRQTYGRPLQLALDLGASDPESPATGQFLVSVLERFTPALYEAAAKCRPPDVLFGSRVLYLIERVAPLDLTQQLVARGLPPPLTLSVNLSEQEYALLLPPGQFAMTFTRASQNDRDAYNTLISNQQAALGYHKHPGGKPRIEDDPIKTEQAKTVVRLAWMGLTAPEIAAFFGWPDSPAAAEKRVSHYIDAGLGPLLRDVPGWANGRRPPQVRPTKRKLPGLSE